MDYKDIGNKKEFDKFKGKVLSDLNDYIGNLENTDYKKAVNLTYWIRDYTNYLKNEKNFKSNFLPIFKRGCIVEINFGYNIGTEYGGVHYAIVLNKNNKRIDPYLTILPLTSNKGKLHYTEFNLKNEFYETFNNKIEELKNKLEEDILISNEEISKIKTEKRNLEKQIIELLKNHLKINIDNSNLYDKDLVQNLIIENLNNFNNISEIKKLFNESSILVKEVENLDKQFKSLKQKLNENEKEEQYLNLCLRKSVKLKNNGSIAKISQITTVDKSRVRDPINNNAPLFDVIISQSTMDEIDKKIKKFL